MKCRYEKPMTKDERVYWMRFIRYTRACVCAAAVKTVYYEFGFGGKAKIPRFVAGMHRRVDALDERFGCLAQEAQRNELARQMQNYDVEYGKRFLTGRREYAGYVHDTMYMAAMLTLIEDFGFGVKRDREHPREQDRESRLSRYFTAIQREVSRVNGINEGLKEDDDRVIMFDHYLWESLLACRLDAEFLKKEVFTWKPKEMKTSSPSSGSSDGSRTPFADLQSGTGGTERLTAYPTDPTARSSYRMPSGWACGMNGKK